MAKDKKKENEKERNYLASGLWCFVSVTIISYFFPDSIAPFGIYNFWKTDGNIFDWLSYGWPILAWGVGVTAFVNLFADHKKLLRKTQPEEYLAEGVLISIFAGVTEEICFRWLIFLNSLWVAKLFNFLLCGFPQWFYWHILGPIANFTTLGYMEHILFHPTSWAIGSAILSTNAFFRDGHKYLGFLGYVNSWYIGMFLFWVTLTHGLLPAIFLHFIYDLLIFTTIFLFLARTKISS